MKSRTSSSPLHILVVSERFHPEEFRVNDLVRHLAGRGHQVRVLTQIPSYPHGRVFDGWRNRGVDGEVWAGARVTRVPTVTGYEASLRRKLLNYLAFAWRGSRAALAGARPDVVLSFQTGPLTSALPAVLLARWRAVPFVIWTQDLWPDSVWAYGFRRSAPRAALLNAFVRFCYRPAARVLVSCAGFRDALAPFLPAGRQAEFVPNWADEPPARTEPRPWARDDRLHLVFAGNLGKVQNLDRLLDAWAGLPAPTAARLRLHLVGDGSHAAHLRRRVEGEGLPGVDFHGRIPAAEMGPVYAASDGLLVSLDDQPIFRLTVPSKFQSCLAAGKPILAVAGGELQRVVADEGLGLTAHPGRVEEIRAMVTAFATLSPEERAAMGSRGRALLERDYRREAILATLDGVLRGAVGRP
ncbi:MAG: glycosyltransferase family 4 protein [bacterium]|nr:glycosyltransferase family 4 protein [bacterium]